MAVIRLREVSVRYPTYTPNSRSIKTVMLSKLGGTMRVHDNTLVVEALNKLDLELADGDRLAIVGHNGAGKTTLLRVISASTSRSTARWRWRGTSRPSST